MANPFDSQLVKDAYKLLNEQQDVSKVIPLPNGKWVRELDFSKDMNDPIVGIRGYAVMPMSVLKKDIVRSINELGESLYRGVGAKVLMTVMSDFEGKARTGNLLAFKMAALAEAEDFLKNPATKRKISMLKRK